MPTRAEPSLVAAALFSVVLGVLSAQTTTPPRYASKIMIHDVSAGTTTLVYPGEGVWEAPNWSRDGRFLLSNSNGRLYRIPVGAPSSPEAIALDPSLRCNNDHDFSPDGTHLAISASSPSSRQSQIHVANADGSSPRLIVSAAPSYFHGWSPDGKYLSFVANRDGRQYDLYRVPALGGDEERLTFDAAHDDGSDYSRDGRWIYFNSNRGGGWNIWRIPSDGGGPDDGKAQRITSDDLEDWFPHPSPDGKSLLFLSFPHGTVGHNDRGLQVQIRVIPAPGETVRDVQPRVLVTFTGGQGSINVNSWSPDSRRFAYVTYEPQPARAGAFSGVVQTFRSAGIRDHGLLKADLASHVVSGFSRTVGRPTRHLASRDLLPACDRTVLSVARLQLMRRARFAIAVALGFLTRSRAAPRDNRS